MTIQHPIEDEVTQLARRVEKARGRLAYQFDPALTEALSEDELLAERELAEKIRGQDRGQRWKEAQAAAGAADRARQTTEAIEKADMRDLLVARKAIAAQRRESSPHAKLASLYRHRAWSLRALAGVVAAGMLWSAVNVQHNIAPGGPGDPLYWFSYLLEGMISVCLIIIMIGTNKVAEWGVVDNRKQVVAAEVALLGLTVTLNTYPYLRAEHWYDAAVHAVAPVMIGVSLLIHDAASARYGLAIHRATDQVRDLPDPAEQIRRTLPTLASYRMRRSADVMAASSFAELTVEAEPDPLAELNAAPASIVDPEIEDTVVLADEDDKAPEPPAPTRSAFRSAAPAPSAKVVAAATLGSDLSDITAETPPVTKSENGTAPGTSKPVQADEPVVPSKPVNGEKHNGIAGKPITPVNGAGAPTKPATPVATKPTPVAATKPVTAAAPKPATPTKIAAQQPAPAKPSKPAAPAPDKAAVAAADRPSATAAASATTAAIKRQPAAADEKAATAADPKAAKDAPATPEIHDTGQFRIAEILEQELAELQAARRRARTSRKTSTPAAGRDR
ncbi:hypothetical protein ABZ942_35715 [Nocardia sp. NPDC046473]|uniref:hypothetical protein n=1 Tax=Nocardia sp. NPDC046473 TaxID=3155733 RepID=UPI0033F0B468